MEIKLRYETLPLYLDFPKKKIDVFTPCDANYVVESGGHVSRWIVIMSFLIDRIWTHTLICQERNVFLIRMFFIIEICHLMRCLRKVFSFQSIKIAELWL